MSDRDENKSAVKIRGARRKQGPAFRATKSAAKNPGRGWQVDMQATIANAWAIAERTNAVLTQLRAAPVVWASEIPRAEEAFAKARARLAANLPRAKGRRSKPVKHRICWLKQIELKTVVPIDLAQLFRHPEEDVNSGTANVATLAFEKNAESEVEFVFADSGTYIVRTMSGHVIEGLRGGIDFEFIPSPPARSR